MANILIHHIAHRYPDTIIYACNLHTTYCILFSSNIYIKKALISINIVEFISGKLHVLLDVWRHAFLLWSISSSQSKWMYSMWSDPIVANVNFVFFFLSLSMNVQGAENDALRLRMFVCRLTLFFSISSAANRRFKRPTEATTKNWTKRRK